MTADAAAVTLINVNQVESRTVTVQGGAYGEHQIIAVDVNREGRPVNGRSFDVVLGPDPVPAWCYR